MGAVVVEICFRLFPIQLAWGGGFLELSSIFFFKYLLLGVKFGVCFKWEVSISNFLGFLGGFGGLFLLFLVDNWGPKSIVFIRMSFPLILVNSIHIFFGGFGFLRRLLGWGGFFWGER